MLYTEENKSVTNDKHCMVSPLWDSLRSQIHDKQNGDVVIGSKSSVYAMSKVSRDYAVISRTAM